MKICFKFGVCAVIIPLMIAYIGAVNTFLPHFQAQTQIAQPRLPACIDLRSQRITAMLASGPVQIMPEIPIIVLRMPVTQTGREGKTIRQLHVISQGGKPGLYDFLRFLIPRCGIKSIGTKIIVYVSTHHCQPCLSCHRNTPLIKHLMLPEGSIVAMSVARCPAHGDPMMARMLRC